MLKFETFWYAEIRHPDLLQDFYVFPVNSTTIYLDCQLIHSHLAKCNDSCSPSLNYTSWFSTTCFMIFPVISWHKLAMSEAGTLLPYCGNLIQYGRLFLLWDHQLKDYWFQMLQVVLHFNHFNNSVLMLFPHWRNLQNVHNCTICMNGLQSLWY